MKKHKLWLFLILAILGVVIDAGNSSHTIQGQSNINPSFSISNSSPTLGESLIISGEGLAPNTAYYIGVPQAGTLKLYNENEMGARSARLVEPPYLSLDARSNFAVNYDEYEQILFFVDYYAVQTSDVVNRSLRFKSFDIYADNGFEYEVDYPFMPSSYENWLTLRLVLDKAVGALGTGQQLIAPTEGIDAYISQVQKVPAWNVVTDDKGAFTATIIAPRRLSSDGSNGLNFEILLYDQSLENTWTIGAFTLNPPYEDYREIRELIAFHYLLVRPDYTWTDRSAAVFANQIASPNVFRVDWEVGYMGAVFEALGANDLAYEQAFRICRTQTEDGEIGVVRNHSDSAIAGYYTIRSIYEATLDRFLDNCLIRLANYTISNYRADEDVYPQFTDDEYWADAMGIGKTFFLAYIAQRFDNPIYQDAADNIMWFPLQHMINEEGRFIHRYNFVTDEVVVDWWIGAQGWALMGLYEYQFWTEDQSLLDAMRLAAQNLANWLVAQPLSRIYDEDITRASQIAYYLRKLSLDERYDAQERATWAALADQLFLLSVRDKSTDTSNLNRYGITIYEYDGVKWAFTDLFLLYYLDEFFPDTLFFPNNSSETYTLAEPMLEGQLCELLLLSEDLSTQPTTNYVIEVSLDGALLKGNVEPKTILQCTKRPLYVLADGGLFTARIDVWDEALRKFYLNGSGGNLLVQVGDLLAEQTYAVERDGTLWQELLSDSEGNLSIVIDDGEVDSVFQIRLP